MDLFKAYDCIPHELLIAKLEAYGFSAWYLLITTLGKNKEQKWVLRSVIDGKRFLEFFRDQF